MILGAHVIMGLYGFWLPNDPRGSWSEFVAHRFAFSYEDGFPVANPASVAVLCQARRAGFLFETFPVFLPKKLIAHPCFD